MISRGGTWGIAAVIPKYLSLRLLLSCKKCTPIIVMTRQIMRVFGCFVACGDGCRYK